MSQQVAGEELARDAQLMTTTIKPQPPPSSAAVEERKAFLKSQLDGLMWVTVLDSLTMVTGRNSRMAGGAHPPPATCCPLLHRRWAFVVGPPAYYCAAPSE